MTSTTVSTNIERVMGRAMLDEAFRTELFTNPEAAIREAGLALTDSEMDQIKAAVGKIKIDQLRASRPGGGGLGWR